MKKVTWFAFFFVAGMLVFFIGGYWEAITSPYRLVVKIALPVLLLTMTAACGRFENTRKLRPVLTAFFAASLAFLAAHLVSGPLLRLTGASVDTVPGLALAKLFDALPIVVMILAVARLGRRRWSDLFLGKGRVKAWLVVGLVSFAGFAVVFLLQARGQGVGTGRLLDSLPWIVLFVFANGFMEELHFRGLLLRPMAAFLGRHTANLCIALFFTLSHFPVQYTSDIAVFLIVLFVLAVAWGYVIQKTDALWGAVLFHAGADLTVIISIFESYGSGP